MIDGTMPNARSIAHKAIVDITEELGILEEGLSAGRVPMMHPAIPDWFCILRLAMQELGREGGND
jgi:hypothetical protein